MSRTSKKRCSTISKYSRTSTKGCLLVTNHAMNSVNIFFLQKNTKLDLYLVHLASISVWYQLKVLNQTYFDCFLFICCRRHFLEICMLHPQKYTGVMSHSYLPIMAPCSDSHFRLSPGWLFWRGLTLSICDVLTLYCCSV